MGWLSGQSVGWRSKGRGFKSRQEHKKNRVFLSQKGIADSLSVCPTPVCIYMHIIYVRQCMHVKGPCQSSVDYGNTKITSMHLYPQRWNVAAQVVEEIKTVTYATPQGKKRKRINDNL